VQFSQARASSIQQTDGAAGDKNRNALKLATPRRIQGDVQLKQEPQRQPMSDNAMSEVDCNVF
jgi:hypothetical protein